MKLFSRPGPGHLKCGTHQTAVRIAMIIPVQNRPRTIGAAVTWDQRGRPDLPDPAGRAPVTPAGLKTAGEFRHLGHHFDIVDIPAGALRCSI